LNIKSNPNEDTTGFDISSSSNGVLSITLAGHFENGRLKYFPSALTLDELDNSTTMVSGSMMEVATSFLRVSSSKHTWLRQRLPHLLENFLTMDKTSTRFIRTMQKLAKLAREYSSEEIIAPSLKNDELTITQKTRLLAVLAIVSDTSAENVLIEYGLSANCQKLQLQAIFTANSFMKPSARLVNVLYHMYQSNVNNQNAVLYALGSAVGKDSMDIDTKKIVGTFLVLTLSEFIKTGDDENVIVVLKAIGNAGPSVVPIAAIPKSIFTASNVEIRLAAIESLRKYSHVKSASILAKLSATDKNSRVRKAAGVSNINANAFPFNQSWTDQITFGGKQINVVFNGLLFAGSNLDCNHPSFNYEGHARAEAVAHAFGESKSAFLAEALYGKENGQLIGDKLYLKVWDSVLYDKTIPIIDCNEHVNEIGHTAFGFSVSYTLWVSVIPVTFRASTLLQLDLKWGWNICDNQLSALVELIPSATLTVSGGAEINLLIIKAGITLDASFNSIVKPQAFVHGTQCQMGFDAILETKPMTAALVAYFAEKECKYVFFDCHWGKTHQKNLWSWQLPSKTQTLFNKVWNIKP